MFSSYSVAALALFSVSSVFAQTQCPDGTSPVTKLQSKDWVSCGIPSTDATFWVKDLECATINVPKDYTDRTAGTIPLRLIRQPARDPNNANLKNIASSIIMNPGGPGQSGFKSLIDGSGYNIQSQVGADYNVISFDPRGVGLTLPNACSNIQAPKPTDNSYQALAETFQAAADACKKKDPNLQFVGTPFVARDVKAISEATNTDSLIRYIGYSYGTVLGATIASMFPLQISRLVIDGNANVNDYYNNIEYEGYTDSTKTLKQFFILCSQANIDTSGKQVSTSQAQVNCGIYRAGVSGVTLFQEYDAFRTGLTEDQRQNLDSLMFAALYSGQNVRAFSQNLAAFYKDATKLNTPPSKRDLGWDPQQYLVKTPNAIQAISSGDSAQSNRPSAGLGDLFLETFQKLAKLAPYAVGPGIGGPWNSLSWTSRCKEINKIPYSSQQKIKTSYPILVLNTEYDQVTPVVSAQANAGFFLNSIFIKTDEFGHCTGGQNPAAVGARLKTYFSATGISVSTADITSSPQSNPFVTDGNPNNVAQEQPEPVVAPPPAGTQTKRDIDETTNMMKAIFKRHDALKMRKRQVVGTTSTISFNIAVCTPDPYINAPGTSSTTTTTTATGTTTTTTITTTRTTTTEATTTSRGTTSTTSMSTTSSTTTSESTTSTASTSSTSMTSDGSASTTSGSSTSATTKSSTSTTSSGSASTTTSVGFTSSAATTTASGSSIVQSSTSTSTMSGSTASTVTTQSVSQSATITGTQSVTTSASGTGQATSQTGTSTAIQSGLLTSTQSGSQSPSSANGQPYGTWSNWSGVSMTTQSLAASSWVQWSAVPTTTTQADPSAWAQWSAVPTTTKQTDPVPWAQWSSWNIYSSQTGMVPYVQAITQGGQIFTNTYAVPTTTVYLDYVQAVCSTGRSTSTITVTATCNAGCYSKPTGVPQGYTTSTVYCSACATPGVVTVTVQANQTAPASTWAAVSKSTGTGTTTWAGWQSASATGNVAKYTGGVVANTVPAFAAMVPAFFAAFML